MFDNIFNLIFSIIHIAESAIEDDDTAPFAPVADEPPVMFTHPITTAALLTNDQLIGCEVGYRMTRADPWQIGNIRAVQETRFGIKALFTPKDENQSEKWRFLNEFVYVWFE